MQKFSEKMYAEEILPPHQKGTCLQMPFTWIQHLSDTPTILACSVWLYWSFCPSGLRVLGRFSRPWTAENRGRDITFTDSFQSVNGVCQPTLHYLHETVFKKLSPSLSFQIKWSYEMIPQIKPINPSLDLSELSLTLFETNLLLNSYVILGTLV